MSSINLLDRVYSALSSVDHPSSGGPGTLGDITDLLARTRPYLKSEVSLALTQLRRAGKVRCDGRTWSRT